jgi:hypothetical protein
VEKVAEVCSQIINSALGQVSQADKSKLMKGHTLRGKLVS